MPAFHTHAVFADKFYNDNINDEKLFKNECDIETLKSYSLGIDLSMISIPSIDAHNKKTKEFMMRLIRTIKKNKYYNDEYVLSMLYGHVMHYFLDINMHPFIYYHEQGMHNNIVDSHTLFEGYLSNYFLMKFKKLDIYNISSDYYSKGYVTNSKCKNVLDSVYKHVYKLGNINSIYLSTISLLTKGEKVLKNIFDLKSLKEFLGFNRVVSEYDLTDDDFINKSHKRWFHPISCSKSDESIDDLFNKAYEQTCYAISSINEYLYNNISISILENIFTGLSYDTGLSCQIPKKFAYHKVYKRVK